MLDLNSTHINDLIAKYLSNNTSEEEMKTLEQWVLADRQNKNHFIEMKKAWMLGGIKQADAQQKTEKAWTNLNKQLFDNQQPRGKVIPLYRKPFAIAASIALLVISGWLIYQVVNPSTASGPFIAETTTKSAPYKLADGSDIILNQESAISFKIAASNRIAKLQGDAYFNITKNKQQPFIIKTDDIQVKVLGTAFYVDSRKEQPETQVIVEEGKVEVTFNNQVVTLVAGDKAVLNKATQKLVKVTNEDTNFNSLKTNVLQFENTSLQEVAFALSRQFNVDVNLQNNQLKQCKLDAVFKQKSLKSVIKIIESTLGVSMKQNGKIVSISGTCN